MYTWSCFISWPAIDAPSNPLVAHNNANQLAMIAGCLQALASKLAQDRNLSEEERRVIKLQFLMANYARVRVVCQ